MKNKLSLTEDFLPGEEEAADVLGYNPDAEPTLEDQGWEYVASKDVYDEDGFRDVYYWYKKDGNNRFFFSSDVDYGDPEYFDWETDGEEAAREWFDSYGEDEDDLTLVDNREAAILDKGDDPGFDEYDRVDDNPVNEAADISDEEDSNDTLDDIATRLEKVNQPTYRGARIPAYNADAINESELPDNMRAKYYEARVTRDSRIAFSWITEEPFTETDADIFKEELDRYFTRIVDNSNYEGPIYVDVTVSCRDGDEWGHSEFTLSHPNDQLEESFNDTGKSTKEDILEYAKLHGDRSAADLLLLGGYEFFDGTADEYDALLKELEGKAGSEGVDESFNNSSSSYYLTTVGDMIDGAVGNVDDEDIDKDLKFWRTVARTFNFVPGADNVAVLIADGEYDPEYYYPSWTNKPRAIAKKYPNAVFYDVPFFCVKEVKNGKMFLYFDSEESAKKYVDLIDSGIDFEDQSNFGDPELDESCKKPIKEAKDSTIYSWYKKEYPDDYQLEDIAHDVTFEQAKKAVDDGKSLYDVMGMHLDTQVIDRISVELKSRFPELKESCDKSIDESTGHENKNHIELALSDGSLDKDTFIDYILEHTPDDMLAGVVDLIMESDNLNEALDNTDTQSTELAESFDDDYDDFELAGIYGGDMIYCPICGRRLEYTEDGDQFCPKCKKSAWDLAQERRKRDKNESIDSSDDLSDEEMNEACSSNVETEENLDECDYNNLEDDPVVDVSDLRAPADPHEKEKLQEFGPAAAAIVSAVAPVVADKVLDKILPENAPATTVDETEVQGAGEEDDIDESILNTL